MLRLMDARRLLDEAEHEDRVRMGRLEEGEDALLEAVARGRYACIGTAKLRLPVYRSVRAGRRRADGHTEVPIHISLSFVSKRRGAVGPNGEGLTSHEAAARHGRVYLHPGRGELALVRAAGAHRDRRLGGWWIPEAQFHAQPELHRFATRSAQNAGVLRRAGRGKVRNGAAAAFQLYVECAAADDEGRMADLLHDEEGPISLGTIGDTPTERAAFWRAVSDRERADGRVQNRAIIELPHELTAAEMRPLTMSIVAPLAERGLAYHAAVHRPDVVGGSDPRNVHLHILWSERPAMHTGPMDWVFAACKDRGAQGPAWVKCFREKTVAAINGALDRAEVERGVHIARRYHAGRYTDLGIEKPPGLHLGPRRTALERSGVPTAAAIANVLRERVWARLVASEQALARTRHLLELAGRPGIPEAVAERLAALAETMTAASPAAASASAERAVVRMAWADQARSNPGRGESGALRARLAEAEAEKARRIVETATPVLHMASEGTPPESISAMMKEAVRTSTNIGPWSVQDDRDRAADLLAFAEGRLDALDATRQEVERRYRAAKHAGHALAAVDAAVPISGSTDPAWTRRRARAAAELEMWSTWESRAADLMAGLPRLSAPEAQARTTALLAHGGPPALARRRRRARERSR